jgi:hypothetical protein
MVVVYVASKYSIGDKEENTKASMKVGDQLIKLGYVPFLPLLSHYQHLLYPQSYDMWLNLGLEMVRRCNVVLRLEGESRGADIEVSLAKELGKPVVYSLEELHQLNIPIEEFMKGMSVNY